MLVERLLPACDAARAEHRVVAGEPEAVYEAVRAADFMQTYRSSVVVRLLFGARSLAERTVAALCGRRHEEPPEPERLTLADMSTSGEWVMLGEEPPREIAFGTIGRFWAGETVWQQIDASEFAGFDRPGFAKIACSFSLRPYGDQRTLVTYECRTRATDPKSRRAFLRYWRALSPFIGAVMRAQLKAVEATAR
jgi:hypothetical protein